MRSKQSSNLSLLIFLIILLIGALVEVLYNPLSSIKHSIQISHARAEFPQAREKWNSLNITNYRFEIQGDTPSICQPSAIIEVKDGVVDKVETKDSKSGEQVLPIYKWADPDWGDEVFLCNYNHFTVEKIFDFFQTTLDNNPQTIMKADFDAEYGFIADFRYGLYVGYGLLRPDITDCCSEFQIRNFQPIK